MRTADMLETFPGEVSVDQELLARTIDTLVACSQTCTACADACLSEDSVEELRSCITTDLNCADICSTAARVLSRNTAFNADIVKALLQACIESCRICEDECQQHADHHEHCRICAESCRECVQVCNEFLVAIS